MEYTIKDLSGFLLNKQYKLIKKLGAGAFGEIYSATANGQEYAIKIERSDTKYPQLLFESKLYQYLNNQPIIGIPKYYGYYQQDNFNFLVMEQLGKSLEDIFTDNNRLLSLQSVTVLALQMLECVEYLHTKHFLHRDIKPDNFLLGKAHKDRVYMVDYGLAKKYMIKDSHIPYKDNKALTGTARYASINTHLGIEQSRRDDLESLGYVLLYFLRGSLPWQNLRANNQKEKYDRIMEKKLATSSETLCKNSPKQFYEYIEYSKNLKFDEKPDYQYMKNLFISVMKENDLRIEYIYDWDDENTHRDKILLKHTQESNQPDQQQPIVNKNINYSQYNNNRQSIQKTKTSSIHSINKVLKIQQNTTTLNTQQNCQNKNQINNKAKSIIKKHSSLHQN
ncbi:unnamed protein product (macronuclear) [Paramecium tetraurelia]|uniref:Casein kinase I n=1 Tax=Paramecium tetraurelia TaxID=5888 RepID=A0DED1_PARTE|nr:uncharacterized protein GSPATT00016224001 [Paramecium tetraurelia]CAK81398.1 unnamed protein product [Paramecium tetraurelia]|eukprot:XP_001448795.1 hypothetical protein (macronuclear) [Paramecium tetraurelia strain d4-2]